MDTNKLIETNPLLNRANVTTLLLNRFMSVLGNSTPQHNDIKTMN